MHPRRTLRTRALFTHIRMGWQRYVSLENLGLGGARVVLDQQATPGDEVTVSLVAPTLWDPLVLKGHVAWIAVHPAPSSVSSVPPALPTFVSRSNAREPGVMYAVGVAFESDSPELALALCELVLSLTGE